MQDFLHRPYYFNRNENNRIKSIFGISLGLFLFLLLFNPFEFDKIESKNQVYYFFGFGVFTLIVLSIDLLLIPKLFNREFLEKRWKILYELLWNLFILFSLSGAYFGFICFTHIMPINYTSIVNLVLLAALPVCTLITINQDMALKKYFRTLLDSNNKTSDQTTKADVQVKKVRFKSDNKHEELEINIYELLYIQSIGNYIHVFWNEKGVIKHKLIRATLNNTQKQLKKHKFIFQCFRSVIVNIYKIDKIIGNSNKGYKIKFSKVDELIPVSRNKINLLKDKMRKLQKETY